MENSLIFLIEEIKKKENFNFKKEIKDLNIPSDLYSNAKINFIFLNLNLKTIDQEILVEGEILINATFSCDICLKKFTKEIKENFNQLYETILLKELNLWPDIRETIILSEPMKNICSQTCKNENDKYLKNQKKENNPNNPFKILKNIVK